MIDMIEIADTIPTPEIAHIAELEAMNADLKAQLAEANNEITTLKKEAKSVEAKAAEIYGAQAAPPVECTAKGDINQGTLKARFAAITDPRKQSAFLQGLSPQEQSKLFSSL